MRFFLLSFLCLAIYFSSQAQPVIEDLPQVTNCIALINVRAVTTAGKNPEKTNIIIRDGIITDMEASVAIPPDAFRVQGDSLYAYPAFIDAYSLTGIKEEQEAQGGPGGQANRQRPAIDPDGNPSLEDAGITPFTEVRSFIDPKSKSIAEWRAQGFAITHTVPKKGMIPGKGAVLVLSGKNTDELLWKEDVSLHAQWAGANGAYPSTVIGIMAKWRELYQNALQYTEHQSYYDESGLVSRPAYNQAHEALTPVIRKEMPVFFRAAGVKDISRVLELQKDLGMRIVISDAKEAYYLLEELKSNQLPVVLSLELPKDLAASKEETQKEKGEEVKKDSLEKDPEKASFEKKRAESLQAHRAQAATLSTSNIPFSFGTYSIRPADFSKNIKLILDEGLSAHQALDALTMQPAKLLGIDTKCGSLQPGKMANVLLSDKPLFEKDAAIRFMIVEGAMYEYEEKPAKKKSDKSSSSGDVLAGQWSFFIDSLDMKREGTFEFTVTKEEINGTLKGKNFTTGNETLESIVINDNEVSFTFDFEIEGQIIPLEFDITITDDTFDGTVSSPDIGSYAITGTRITKPDQQ